MQVMISYSRRDEDRVTPIAQYLAENGVQIWRDRTNMTPGGAFRDELIEIAKTCDAVIPFLSESYVASQYCRMELYIARCFDRRVLPVMLEECWSALDREEETMYLSAIFSARFGARRIVGLEASEEELRARLLRALRAIERPSPRETFACYLSFPNGGAREADALVDRVGGPPVRPWIATRNCEIGDNWRQIQIRAMMNSKAHVVLLTSGLTDAEGALTPNAGLRTEVLLSEALGLALFPVVDPTLEADDALKDRVISALDGDRSFRRIAERQYFRFKDAGSTLREALLAQSRERRKKGFFGLFSG